VSLPDRTAPAHRGLRRVVTSALRRHTPRLIALCALPLLAGCGEGWAVISPTDPEGLANLRFLLAGVGLTLGLSAIALLAGVLLGLALAALRLWGNRAARLLAAGYVELIRALPLFVLLLWVYYALPIVVEGMPEDGWGRALLGWTAGLSPFTAAALALGLNAAAFLSEIFRAGIEGIPRGQVEAARALGMTPWQIFRLVILPQALRQMLSPTIGQFIQTVKDSSLASVLGLAELTRRATELQTQTYRPLEIYTLLALEYLVLLLILSQVARWIERRSRPR
jgi:polar amino acid transport system permease protein